MQDIIIYDWLSFTSKRSDPYYIADLLGLSHLPWQTTKGAHGYQNRLYFNCISIHFNGRDDMGTWCEMSGQGCRAFESLSTLTGDKWADLFALIAGNHLNITRLDVAYDDHDGTLDIDQIVKDTWDQNFVSRTSDWGINLTSKGTTVTFGSPKSEILIRIYDKARERNCSAGEHWIRCELQLRRDRALSFVDLNLPIGQAFCGVVMNYLRFVEEVEGDSNKWRWPLKTYWANLLENANKISIYHAPGLEYNLDRCEKYVINQAGNAIDAYIQCVGMDGFVNALNNRKTRPSPKYDRMVSEFRELCAST